MVVTSSKNKQKHGLLFLSHQSHFAPNRFSSIVQQFSQNKQTWRQTTSLLWEYGDSLDTVRCKECKEMQRSF